MDRGAWWATIHGVVRGCTELDTTERLHFHFLLRMLGVGGGLPGSDVCKGKGLTCVRVCVNMGVHACARVSASMSVHMCTCVRVRVHTSASE